MAPSRSIWPTRQSGSDAITQSILSSKSPTCLARESPPSSMQHRSSRGTFWPSTHPQHRALAPSTRSTYASGNPLWEISDSQMPASYALLCTFIGEYKGSVSWRTIRSWLSGIRAWHLANHAPWFEGSCPKHALCAPVSIKHLLALRNAIIISTPFHAAVWAIAMVTFFGCRHLGGTTVSSISSFDSKCHVLCSADVTFKTLQDNSRLALFHIPWTKTTHEEEAHIIVTAHDDQLCPCDALQNYLNINKDVPGGASLFAYHRFMGFCTSAWTGACLAHVLSHSFRIVPPEIVAATGGWTSLAFLLYWRWMEEILPMSTSRASQRSHVDELAKIFKQFCINNHIPSSLIASSDHAFEL
ncbi:hypothetical protein BYT27DRAFT_7219923 [Phlegmacium glaucopus]|nr:hypothetical protein BYT27DRAFT_7219923 [Phlegmacium glaucopus]